MFKYFLGYAIAFTVMVVLALDNPRLSKIYIEHYYEDQTETYYDNKIENYYEDQVETYYDNKIEYQYEDFKDIQKNDFNENQSLNYDSEYEKKKQLKTTFRIVRALFGIWR